MFLQNYLRQYITVSQFNLLATKAFARFSVPLHIPLCGLFQIRDCQLTPGNTHQLVAEYTLFLAASSSRGATVWPLGQKECGFSNRFHTK